MFIGLIGNSPARPNPYPYSTFVSDRRKNSRLHLNHHNIPFRKSDFLHSH